MIYNLLPTHDQVCLLLMLKLLSNSNIFVSSTHGMNWVVVNPIQYIFSWDKGKAKAAYNYIHPRNYIVPCTL